MLRTIVWAESLALLKTARFALALLLCVLSFTLVAFAQRQCHLAASRDYRIAATRALDNLRSMDPIETELLNGRQMYVPSSPPPMGPLFARQTTVDPTMARLPRSPLTVFFSHMDYTVCAAMFLSLLGLLSSFDAVSGDGQTGPTRLLLSSGIAKAKVLLGKVAARVGLLSVSFATSVLLGALVAWPGGTALFGLEEWLALSAFVVAGTLYAAVFVLAGLLVSVTCRSTESSLVVALTLWVVAAVSIPAMVPAFSATIEPAASSWAMHQALDRQSMAGVAASKEATRRCDEIGCRGSLFAWFANDSSGYLDAKEGANDSVATVIQEHTSSVIRQARTGLVLSRITPYTCMLALGGCLSGTGIEESLDYTHQKASHRSRWFGAWVQAFRRDQTTVRDLSGELPFFVYHWRPLPERLASAASDVALLCCWAILLFLTAYALWSRRDETSSG